MSDMITFAAVIEAARELTQERDKLRKQLAMTLPLLVRLSRCPIDMYIILSQEAKQVLAKIEKIKP